MKLKNEIRQNWGLAEVKGMLANNHKTAVHIFSLLHKLGEQNLFNFWAQFYFKVGKKPN